MTTILRCSIFSILKLEKLQLDPADHKILKNDLHFCVRKQEFTLHPGTNLQPGSKANASSKKRSTCCPFLALFALAILLFSFIVKATFPYPLHASCLVKWEFAEPCVFVVQRLRSQIMKWSSYEVCDAKCLYKMYKLTSYENDTIQASHTSPKYNVMDDIDILFFNSSNRSCIALAESRPKIWYTLFDNGRNYCNLHNLIVGAGYDINDNFLEFTNNLICTQYDMAYCD